MNPSNHIKFPIMKTSILVLAFASFSSGIVASAQTATVAGCCPTGACCKVSKSCCLTPLAAKSADAPSSADAALIAQARAAYPLKTCLVSDEALGSMGEALGYVHRAAGQPDRVVFFCCGGCTDDFKAEPAKFLAKLDAAKKK